MLMPIIASVAVLLLIAVGLAAHHSRAGASLFPQPALAETRKALAPIYEPGPVDGDPFAS
ncbi:MAG: hypothetical protein OEM97_02725 [Acidimicrobiia bacterium]|nr:hypothetical protein [Acidimicrobiia bacterium]